MIDKIKKLRVKFINFKEKDKSEKINIQKVKEVCLLVTAVVLVGIGYTNFSTKSMNSQNIISDSIVTSSNNNIGDVQLVSSTAAVVENNEENVQKDEIQQTSAIVNNEEVKENESVAVSTNKQSFTELRNERDIMYSRSLETYQKILDNESVSSEQKSIAIQEIDKISQMQNSINIAEELIKLKGFEDVVIYFVNDKASVVVRIAALSDAQVAQIQNIVSTQLGVEISNISISNK